MKKLRENPSLPPPNPVTNPARSRPSFFHHCLSKMDRVRQQYFLLFLPVALLLTVAGCSSEKRESPNQLRSVNVGLVKNVDYDEFLLAIDVSNEQGEKIDSNFHLEAARYPKLEGDVAPSHQFEVGSWLMVTMAIYKQGELIASTELCETKAKPFQVKSDPALNSIPVTMCRVSAADDDDPIVTEPAEQSSDVTIIPSLGENEPNPPLPNTGAGDLPKRLLIGYWHNWDIPDVQFVRLRDVSPAWDIIQIAFAEPITAGSAIMNFVPDSNLTSVAQFKEDVAYLQSQGKKVLISIGGANAHLNLQTEAMKQDFIDSMAEIIRTYGFDGLDIDLEGGSFSLAAGDVDFKNPVTPGIKNMIAAVRELHRRFDGRFLLTMAPETAYVQGGYGNFGNIWGAYLPVIHGLRDILTFIHVQHYNSGSMIALDEQAYTQGTADFQVAMTEMLLQGFPVGRNPNAVFPPLRADQIAIGLPAVGPAAPAGGFTPSSEVHKAFRYLVSGQSFGGQYTLRNPQGYPDLRGLMTWSINWDAKNNFEFSRSHRAFLNQLP